MRHILHKYFRKPDDPRATRFDTLADALESHGIPYDSALARNAQGGNNRKEARI